MSLTRSTNIMKIDKCNQSVRRGPLLSYTWEFHTASYSAAIPNDAAYKQVPVSISNIIELKPSSSSYGNSSHNVQSIDKRIPYSPRMPRAKSKSNKLNS